VTELSETLDVRLGTRLAGGRAENRTATLSNAARTA